MRVDAAVADAPHVELPPDYALAVAFDGKPPQFPRVGRGRVGVYTDGVVTITPFGKGSSTTLPVIDDDLAKRWTEPPSASSLQRLRSRADAIREAITDMAPFDAAIKLNDSFQIGLSRVKITGGRAGVNAPFYIDIRPAEGSGAFQHEHVEDLEHGSHEEDEATVPCEFDPESIDVYSRKQQALVVVHYHHHLDCSAWPDSYRLYDIP
jgi:hypothetical protein